MLRRDLILVQIEELGKVLAQLIDQRNNHSDRNTDLLLNTIYSTLHVDKDYLLSHTPEETQAWLDGEDKAGLQRLEIAAKTMIEESYLSDTDSKILLKAKEILRYIQEHDQTFSLERMDLLREVENRLADVDS